MFKYTKDRISVLTVIDSRRPSKSGEYPIKVQVVYKRIQKYYLTGKEISIEDWTQLPKLKSRKHIELKESIENSFSLIKSNVEYLAEKGMFSFDALNSRLCIGAYDTLNNTFKAKISLLQIPVTSGHPF
jgi:integrase/recombinase XerD